MVKLKKGYTNPRLVETRPGEYTFCCDYDGIDLNPQQQTLSEAYLIRKGREFISELQGKKPEILDIHKENFKK